MSDTRIYLCQQCSLPTLSLIAKLIDLALHLLKCNSLAFKGDQDERCRPRSGYRKRDRSSDVSLSLSLSLSHNHAQYCIVLSLHVINTFIHHITHYY